MYESCGDYDPPLDLLMRLASERLDREAFNDACRKLPAFERSHYSHEHYYIAAAKGVGIRLFADRASARVHMAKMTLCLYRPRAIRAREVSGQDAMDRERFNNRYQWYYGHTIERIGPAALTGQDPDGWEFRFAIWRADAGYLVLAQSELDPIIGYDLTYWIRYSDRELPPRVERFTDWLRWEFGNGDSCSHCKPSGKRPWIKCEPSR